MSAVALASNCNPKSARELISVTVTNSAVTSLNNYPIAIPLDQTTFDFSQAEHDGGDVGAWDAITRDPLPHWMESYDPVAGKALFYG